MGILLCGDSARSINNKLEAGEAEKVRQIVCGVKRYSDNLCKVWTDIEGIQGTQEEIPVLWLLAIKGQVSLKKFKPDILNKERLKTRLNNKSNWHKQIFWIMLMPMTVLRSTFTLLLLFLFSWPSGKKNKNSLVSLWGNLGITVILIYPENPANPIFLLAVPELKPEMLCYRGSAAPWEWGKTFASPSNMLISAGNDFCAVLWP